MLKNVYHISRKKVIEVAWTGDGASYDQALFYLGKGRTSFIVVNPEQAIYKDWHSIFKNGINFSTVDKETCVVFKNNDIWFAKLFTQGWTPNKGYRFVDLNIDIPPIVWRINPDFPVNVKFKKDPRLTFIPSIRNRYYKYVWYLETEGIEKEPIWALSCEPSKKTIIHQHEMGLLKIDLPRRLDVIFISYQESNAEENWQRVLKKAPWAKRVNGVRGIFNAHKEAAKQSQTDMFYIVDGDAYLLDEWSFDFQPTIFDRDCAYVWRSKNPINDLEYGNGGVKLFSKAILENVKKWKTLDMFLGIMPKIKFVNEVSCETRFNVDSFSTWRSAFREAVKLYTINQMQLLDSWTKKGKDRPFGRYCIAGALAGIEFAANNKNNFKQLRKINDYKWLKQQFNLQYER